MTAVQGPESMAVNIQVLDDSEGVPNPYTTVKDYMLSLCQPCGSTPEAMEEAMRQAYWVEDRLTFQRAAHRALKEVDCTAAVLEERDLSVSLNPESDGGGREANLFEAMLEDDPLFDRSLQHVTLSCMSSTCLPSQEAKLHAAIATDGTIDPAECAMSVLREKACPRLSNPKSYGPCK